MNTSSLSNRGLRTASIIDFVISYKQQFLGNSYDAQTNPEGIISMAVAENRLCEDILTERMNRPDMTRHEPWMQYYPDARGVKSVRESIAKFMATRFRSTHTIDAEEIYITFGGSGAMDMLAHAYADPGDSFLCPAPHYACIPAQVGCRADVNVHGIQLDPKDGFRITHDLLESAFQEASEKYPGDVKAMFVTSPNNPTGDVYDVSTLRIILEFCHSHDIHAIFDEIFAFSVFDPNSTFHSVLSLDLPNPTKTHVIWGFGKDFALSAYRMGVLCSRDPDLGRSLSPLFSITGSTSTIQQKMATLIEDSDWLDKVYFPTNLSRMRTAYEYSKERLTRMGIPVHPSKSTYFIWADFTKFVHPLTAEGEMELCHQIFLQKLFLLPGTIHGFHTPGWLRIMFTSPHDVLSAGFDHLEEALNRLKKD